MCHMSRAPTQIPRDFLQYLGPATVTVIFAPPPNSILWDLWGRWFVRCSEDRGSELYFNWNWSGLWQIFL